MATLKTRPNDQSVVAFLNGIEDPQQRKDCFTVAEMMQDVTGALPKMWGDSIVGFGSYHYRYPSGREGDWMLTGFSPRKRSLTLYIMSGFSRYEDLLQRLGKHTTGKSCLYIKCLEDVDLAVLRELVEASTEHLAARYA